MERRDFLRTTATAAVGLSVVAQAGSTSGGTGIVNYNARMKYRTLGKTRLNIRKSAMTFDLHSSFGCRLLFISRLLCFLLKIYNTFR